MPALWHLSASSPLMTASSFGVYETMKAYMNTDSVQYQYRVFGNLMLNFIRIEIPCEQDLAMMHNFRGFFGKRKEEKEGIETKKEEDLQGEEEVDKENDDDDDHSDNDDGDLLMPVIEWIGGVIPRLAAELK